MQARAAKPSYPWVSMVIWVFTDGTFRDSKTLWMKSVPPATLGIHISSTPWDFWKFRRMCSSKPAKDYKEGKALHHLRFVKIVFGSICSWVTSTDYMPSWILIVEEQKTRNVFWYFFPRTCRDSWMSVKALPMWGKEDLPGLALHQTGKRGEESIWWEGNTLKKNKRIIGKTKGMLITFSSPKNHSQVSPSHCGAT